MEYILLHSPQKEPTLLTPWPHTFRLWNCETITFCCLKPPSLWHFVTTALANQYRPFKTFFFSFFTLKNHLYLIIYARDHPAQWGPFLSQTPLSAHKLTEILVKSASWASDRHLDLRQGDLQAGDCCMCHLDEGPNSRNGASASH